MTTKTSFKLSWKYLHTEHLSELVRAWDLIVLALGDQDLLASARTTLGAELYAEAEAAGAKAGESTCGILVEEWLGSADGRIVISHTDEEEIQTRPLAAMLQATMKKFAIVIPVAFEVIHSDDRDDDHRSELVVVAADRIEIRSGKQMLEAMVAEVGPEPAAPSTAASALSVG